MWLPVNVCLLACFSFVFLKNAIAAEPTNPTDVLKCVNLPDNVDCKRIHLDLIHDYFSQTAIKPREDSTIKYCEEKRHEHLDLDEVISLYEKYGAPQTNAGNDPVTSLGVLPIKSDGQDWQLPLYQIAEIRYKHLLENATQSATVDLNSQMKLMGMLENDKRVPLLAFGLGGKRSILNVIPMAANVYNLVADKTETPVSYWRSNEQWIRDFLARHENGQVQWKVALEYESDILLHPSIHKCFRPASFSVQFTAIADEKLHFKSEEMTFINNNEHFCGYRPLIDDLTSFVSRRQKALQGKIGNVTDTGRWDNVYSSFFAFNVGGKDYYFGHSKNGRWFITELLPGGKLGTTTEEGKWTFFYEKVTVYNINGRQYFHACCNDKRAFVYEILSGGRLGPISHKILMEDYVLETAFAYSIGGRHFLYQAGTDEGIDRGSIRDAYSADDISFVRENGKNGVWGRKYYKTSPFSVGGRQFYFGYSSENRNWIIRELLSGGRMGNETSSGAWPDEVFRVVFTFSDGRKTLLYRQGTDNSKKHVWYTQELLPGGQMGPVTGHGESKNRYSAVFPFNVERKHYFFAFDDSDRSYYIQELL